MQLTQRDIARFHHRVLRMPGCWVWTGPYFMFKGYGRYWAQGRHMRAHRVAYAIATADGQTLDNERQVVRHACDNRGCCNPAHLVLGSQFDNVDDRNERGRTARGERSASRLTAELVQVLRGEWAQGNIKYRDLAKKYGLPPGTIWHALDRTSWAHV